MLLSTLLFAALASAAPQILEKLIQPPSTSPFYVPAPGWEMTAPGTVLRVRSAPGNLSSLFNASAAYHILYRTTDSLYNATYAVTTLFVPTSGNGSALLSYQIPYDSADVDASPSYALYGGANSDMMMGLKKGWYVHTTDYEGPTAAFVAGVLSGHATIDSIRAVKAVGLGLASNAKVALWGYSGGALASEWAIELAPSYAPELEIAGAALGGLTPNVTSVLLATTGTLYAGLSFPGTLGLASQHPQALTYLLSQLKTDGPYNRTGFLAARNYTLNEAIVAYNKQNISDYFVNGLTTLMNPILTRVQDYDGIMGRRNTPQVPMFWYSAQGDEVTPIVNTDKLYTRYCEIGYTNVLFQRNTVGGHTTESSNGLGRAMDFLSKTFSGTWSHTGCTRQNVTISNNNVTSLAY
ncbi:secretory lipase-domain-containing protein [Protomyces lactucae-debilis]|uniref:Secretory lipase-domain-containing protein n=1 Tax=Protomyces lactucae-debilis TaxID=2754530 RepID=A0A1Y2FN67_PROLT|nr:secretory lipase-domain-containing protein [Protomyces lactucae-debilis]ORY85441.1 secretory lipase-domain-containing protein [Protomyces lactucae-debilis]